MAPGSQWAYLIVNADDYGYFDCVSRGILESASHGIVTATGVFANSLHFEEHATWLLDYPTLDLGVHLNLTDREPLTVDMKNKLSRWAGRFSDKYASARAVLSGAINAEDVKLEWQAQIERCLNKGLKIRFLNSHEHIHMLPPLFPVVQALAKEYGIPHIRFPTSKPFQAWTMSALVRDILMKLLAMVNRRHIDIPVAHFLGMEQSGKLDLGYLQKELPCLQPGQVYELMCHPGHYEEQEVHDQRLLSCHDWKGEFDMLTNPAVRDMLHEHRIQLIGYRHLEIQAGQFVIRDEAT